MISCRTYRKTVNRRDAFTLIELLVVIAIIALLLSILMPALSKAKMQAKVIVCSAQFKQLGLAMVTYITENKDHYPPFIKRAQDGSYNYDTDSWVRLYQDYLIKAKKTVMSSMASKIFYCPLGPVPNKTVWQSSDGKTSGKWAENSHYITYGYNFYLFDNVYSESMSGVKRPMNVTPTTSQLRASQLLIIVDNANMHNASCSNGAFPSSMVHKSGCPRGCDYVSRNHPKNMAGVLFGDNHVEQVSRDKLDKPYYTGGQLNAKWYREYPWHVAW